MIFVNTQIVFNEVPGFHAQGFGDPFNISLIENRAGCFATVGTGKTINFFEHFFVRFMKGIVHGTGIFLLQ
jgi:hypothetical protein